MRWSGEKLTCSIPYIWWKLTKETLNLFVNLLTVIYADKTGLGPNLSRNFFKQSDWLALKFVGNLLYSILPGFTKVFKNPCLYFKNELPSLGDAILIGLLMESIEELILNGRALVFLTITPIRENSLLEGSITIRLLYSLTRVDSTTSLHTKNNIFSFLVKSSLIFFSFIKWAIPGIFFLYFCLFKTADSKQCLI